MISHHITDTQSELYIITLYLHVQLQRDRSDIRVEAEEAVSGGPQPLAEVLGVGHGGTESHNPHLALYLRGHVAHAGTHHLQHRLQRGEGGGGGGGGERGREG